MKKQFIKKLTAGSFLVLMAASTCAAEDHLTEFLVQPSSACTAEAKNNLLTFVATAKPTKIECISKNTHNRSIWKRVISFGMLSEQYDTTEKTEFGSVPGGVGAIRFVMSRNPEMALVFSTLSEKVDPTIMKSEMVCSSQNQDPLKIQFHKNDAGKAIYEIGS